MDTGTQLHGLSSDHKQFGKKGNASSQISVYFHSCDFAPPARTARSFSSLFTDVSTCTTCTSHGVGCPPPPRRGMRPLGAHPPSLPPVHGTVAEIPRWDGDGTGPGREVLAVERCGRGTPGVTPGRYPESRLLLRCGYWLGAGVCSDVSFAACSSHALCVQNLFDFRALRT